MLKIDYFNPVVDDWNAEAQRRELRERILCNFVFYYITPRMTGVYSIAEAVDDSNKRPSKTIFGYTDSDDEYTFDKGQLRSLEAVAKMIECNGAKVICDLAECAKFLNSQIIELVDDIEPRSTSLKGIITRNRSRIAYRNRIAIRKQLGMCGVYVVRDGEQAIYVGSTNYSVVERLPEHLHNKSKLGLYIMEHSPESDEWVIDFYRVADKNNLRKREKEIADNLNPLLQ